MTPPTRADTPRGRWDLGSVEPRSLAVVAGVHAGSYRELSGRLPNMPDSPTDTCEASTGNRHLPHKSHASPQPEITAVLTGCVSAVGYTSRLRTVQTHGYGPASYPHPAHLPRADPGANRLGDGRTVPAAHTVATDGRGAPP